MFKLTHPHLLHVLSSIKDSFCDLSPEETSLDLAAAEIFIRQLHVKATAVTTVIGVPHLHLHAVNEARRAMSDAADALSGSVEEFQAALAAYAHTVDAAHSNTPLESRLSPDSLQAAITSGILNEGPSSVHTHGTREQHTADFATGFTDGLAELDINGAANTDEVEPRLPGLDSPAV